MPLLRQSHVGGLDASCLSYLQVGVVLVGQGHLSGVLHLLLVLLEDSLVNLDLRRSQSGGGDEFLKSALVPCSLKDAQTLSYQSLVADEFPGEPEEGFLEVVVRLGGDIVVLEVLLAVEGDGLGLDLALLNVDLVTGQDDGNVLANANEITCRWSARSFANFRAMTYGASWGRSCM